MECYFVSLKVKVFWREMKKEKKLKFKEKKGLSSFLYLHCSGGLLSIHSWASIGRVISPPRMVKSRASSVLCTAAPDVRLSSSCQVMIDSFDPMTDQACFTRGICCILAGTRELHTASCPMIMGAISKVTNRWTLPCSITILMLSRKR